MIIAAIYSHHGGYELMKSDFASQLSEIETAIANVNTEVYRTKRSDEKTSKDQLFYNPTELNKSIKASFETQGWRSHREQCDYLQQYYVAGYTPRRQAKSAYREMDFVKVQVGVEVQFGKYAFAVYYICAKMTIFRNLGIIKAGVEIVPVMDLTSDMSSGIIYFEQLIWDLEHRGPSNIDTPVMVIGVAASMNDTDKQNSIED